MFEGERRFDQRRHPCRCVQMTDIGLHRAERTRCPAWLLTLTKDLF